MKNFIGVLLVVVLFASASFAEFLTTANPIGQGKWAVLGAYISDSGLRMGALTGLTGSSIGGYAGYGLDSKTDIFVQAGQMTYGNGVTAKVNGYGTLIKYQIASESADLPVSVAVGAGYKLLSIDAGGATTGGNQIIAAVGVSKLMLPFLPYGGLAYRGTNFAGTTTSTQMDLTLGSAIPWSEQGAVFVEYTNQFVSASGSSYSAGQIALGVGYTL